MERSILFVAGYYLLFAFTIGLVFVYFVTLLVNLWDKVPFVPTSKRVINYVIQLCDLKKGDKVYDLGCGDARFLIEAQKKTGREAVGYENALLPFLLAKFRKYINSAKINVKMNNLFNADLSDANVIYCYLGPDVMPRLAEKFKKECKKGTRIYSNSFSISTMKPQKIWQTNKSKRLPTIYMYQI